VEEPGFTEADAKKLEQAEEIFRELGSQMRVFAQNETLAVWIVKLLRVRSGVGKCRVDWDAHSLATYGTTAFFRRGFKTRSAGRISSSPRITLQSTRSASTGSMTLQSRNFGFPFCGSPCRGASTAFLKKSRSPK
jgi:hypothetical protein